jgi:hypothetical protein
MRVIDLISKLLEYDLYAEIKISDFAGELQDFTLVEKLDSGERKALDKPGPKTRKRQ